MISSSKININALPTKAYLEATIVPTVMRALTEVSEARPDNPLEFIAYYILKHNPNRKTPTEGAPLNVPAPGQTEVKP
jgi:protein dpy-30